MSRKTLSSTYMHLHLSSSHGDRWGTTDLATLSLYLFFFQILLARRKTLTLST